MSAEGRTGALRLVLGDQLSPGIAALRDLGPARDVVLMAEVMAECTYAPHHPQKIALVLSAMRHFADELRVAGVRLRYIRLDDPGNTQSLEGEVVRAAEELRPECIIATSPGEWRVLEAMRGVGNATGLPAEIREDDRFLCSTEEFRAWAKGRTQARMEFFYREMRRRHRLLMEGDTPAGGRWNFDAENRRKLPRSVRVPRVLRFPPDDITREVLDLVARRFGNHYGDLSGFDYPVTAREAEAALDHFVTTRLPSFGDWQDSMAAGAPFLFHALISAPLNLGLLDPLAICRRAEKAYLNGQAPLNAVEGFIRQILGWREFMRGMYWLHMPDFARRNALGASRPLPDFYWTGDTGMRCIAEVVGQTMRHAYAHHIQRLMITGNFALLAGIDPDAVDQWYLAVYADAYEWVEMPNTRGMALFADDGLIGSKPYAASGAYINRMSDYCQGCHYEVKDATGPRACPFNALYWDFIARFEARWEANPRMAMPLRNWRRMPDERREALRHRAREIRTILDKGKRL